MVNPQPFKNEGFCANCRHSRTTQDRHGFDFGPGETDGECLVFDNPDVEAATAAHNALTPEQETAMGENTLGLLTRCPHWGPE